MTGERKATAKERRMLEAKHTAPTPMSSTLAAMWRERCAAFGCGASSKKGSEFCRAHQPEDAVDGCCRPLPVPGTEGEPWPT